MQLRTRVLFVAHARKGYLCFSMSRFSLPEKSMDLNVTKSASAFEGTHTSSSLYGVTAIIATLLLSWVIYKLVKFELTTGVSLLINILPPWWQYSVAEHKSKTLF